MPDTKPLDINKSSISLFENDGFSNIISRCGFQNEKEFVVFSSMP